MVFFAELPPIQPHVPRSEVQIWDNCFSFIMPEWWAAVSAGASTTQTKGAYVHCCVKKTHFNKFRHPNLQNKGSFFFSTKTQVKLNKLFATFESDHYKRVSITIKNAKNTSEQNLGQPHSKLSISLSRQWLTLGQSNVPALGTEKD